MLSVIYASYEYSLSFNYRYFDKSVSVVHDEKTLKLKIYILISQTRFFNENSHRKN